MKQRHLLNAFVVLILGLLQAASAVGASGREAYLSLVHGETKGPCGHVVVQILPDRNVPKDWKMRWYVLIHTPKGYRLPLGYVEDKARLGDDSKLTVYIPAGEYKFEIRRRSEQWATGVSKQYNLVEGVRKCVWPGTVKVGDVTVPVEDSGVTIVNISYQNARVVKEEKKGRRITSYIWEHPRLLVDKGSVTDLREEEPALYPLVKYAELDKIDGTHLIESLKKDNGSIASTALFNCEELDARPISAALEDESLKLSMHVARILAKAGDESAVMPLIGILKQSSTGSTGAAWTLGELGAEEAVDPLIAALKDESVVLRNNAAYALARIRDRRAVDALIEATEDTDSFEGQLLIWDESEIYTAYLIDRDKGTIGHYFPTPSNEVRENAIYALGQIGGEKAVRALLSLIDDPDANVQMETVFALGNHSNEEVVDAVLRKLKSDHQMVRWMAAQVLGNVGAKKALDSLKDLAAKDSDELVREAAKKALENIDKASQKSESAPR